MQKISYIAKIFGLICDSSYASLITDKDRQLTIKNKVHYILTQAITHG